MKLFTLFYFILITSIFAREKLSYICESLENPDDALSQENESPSRAAGSAQFKITEEQVGHLRSLSVTGYTTADYLSYQDEIYDPSEASYLGFFYRYRHLESQSTYFPPQYKGYSRFKKFDAQALLWRGELFIQSYTQREAFQAHYVFKATNQMEGTLHMTCTPSDKLICPPFKTNFPTCF